MDSKNPARLRGALSDERARAARCKLYGTIAITASTDPDLATWMMENGLGQMTVCPECNLTRFRHIPQCSIGQSVAGMAAAMQQTLQQVTDDLQTSLQANQAPPDRKPS